MANTRVVHRAPVKNTGELADELVTVDRLFPRIDEKYLLCDGKAIMGVEVVETTLSDGSTVQDVYLLTEVMGRG